MDMVEQPVFTIVECRVPPPGVSQRLPDRGWMVVDDAGEPRFTYPSLAEAVRRVATLAQGAVASPRRVLFTYSLPEYHS